MAYAGRTQNYMLVNNDTILWQSLQELQVNRSARLAVDCEGVDLSRDGELTIVTVATEEKAYIFDIVALKQAAFDQGLRAILEDSTREKLMFDCREDSDALWHHYRVKLTGIVDIQLLEIITRYRLDDGSSTSGAIGRMARRSDRMDEVRELRGFARCLETYTSDRRAIQTKNAGSTLFKQDRNVWRRRPLPESLLRYCAVDTLQMFPLYTNLLRRVRGGDVLDRLKEASERYADVVRGKSIRRTNYERNGFLPLDVITDVHQTGAAGAMACNGCLRDFPLDEFRNVERKCRVCRRVDERNEQRRRQQQGRFNFY